MSNKKEYLSLFLNLLFLTGFFLTIEISYFIQCNNSYLTYFNFISSNLQIPAKIIPSIIYFIFAQLILHIGYCCIIWLITILIANLHKSLSNKMTSLGIVLWLLGIMTILVANYYYFPNSKFADIVYPVLFNQLVTQIILLVLFLFCSIAMIIALLGLIKIIYKQTIAYLIISITILSIVGFKYFNITKSSEAVAYQETLPNIFIIGIDSLRPDFLGFFGHDIETPFFDSFLNSATVFSEAVTPIARTFPSWNTILTGQYPRETSIRTNLAQQIGVDSMTTLPKILQQYGYETIYATDETRFSNIGKNYGFDQIITPPMGLNDFLIGSFNDFPLSNFIINTSMGKWLFPYSYANRPVFFTYDPNSFLTLIKPAITEEHHKPLFFAIHFCLPHYPYLWNNLSGREITKSPDRYVESIKRVDKQVSDFLNLLKRHHLLDQAIVVMLSDHGEALELDGDRITEQDLFLGKSTIPKFYPPSLDNEAINQSTGHGTDVLGLTQYHTLLAFKFYGDKQFPAKVIPGVVSLLDIKPTLLQLLKITDATSSGTSLVNGISGHKPIKMVHRHIFLESDFSPMALRTVYPEAQQVLLEGIELFQVKPGTTDIVVKDAMNQMIINSKQYADIFGGWMLALYPQNASQRMPILVNLNSGQWTNDLHSHFADNSPAKLMLARLKSFYGNELNGELIRIAKK